MDVKWIKITVDMFDNRKIKHIRKMPDGNNLVLIWVMLLTMAGRCNSNGMIFLTEKFPYTPKMLADELDFEENTVRLALEVFEALGMVSFDGDFLSITGWEDHQNIDGLERIREQNRIRKQKQRERQKMLLPESRDCHVTVTQSHATDIDIDKEIDKDNNIRSSDAVKEEFESLWKLYPRKQGSKKKAFDAYKRARQQGTSYEDVEQGIKDYVTYINVNHIEKQYIKHGLTFFSQQAWTAEWMPEAEADDLDGIL